MFDFSSCLTNIACVTSDGHEYSYSDIKRLSDEFSNYIIPHTMMFIGCSNSLESLIAYISCMRYHIVPLLLNRDIDTGTLDNLVSVYRPQYLFFPQDRCAIFEDKEILLTKNGFSLLKGYEGIDILPKNLSLLLTTSGSTGSPKLVRLSEENLESNAYSIIKYLNITSSERAITSLPMYYSYGLSVINSHLLAGATLLLTDKSYIQRDFWNFATIENATSFAGVPFTYEILKKMRFEKFFPASIKVMTQAGGKLSSSLVSYFADYAQKNQKDFFVMYGQTEATARMSYLPPECALIKSGSIGIAIPGGSFSLVDDSGNNIMCPEQVGELVYHGSNVSLGYAESFEDLFKEDENKGVLYTGDLAYFDSDGFYYIAGRKKRFLKLYGNRVSLDFVETLLKDCCSECACVGTDDKLIVYITEQDKQETVQSYLKSRISLNPSAYEVRIIQEIPRSESGKIVYAKLSNV